MNSNETVNGLLVDLFNDIIELEEKVLITGEFKNISKNDMHIIDAIGSRQNKNMSTLAKKLKVTVGTITIAINNLVKKGYVNRLRSKEDKRVVLVSLSDKGERAYARHFAFHRDMVDTILKGLDEEETQNLIETLKKIHVFVNKHEV